jgi:acetyl-CoA synthetase
MMLEGRDQWLQPLLDQASDNSEIMDAEDPLFILYSTGKPKVWFILRQDIWYTAYTFKNVFNYEEMIFFGVPLILVGLLDIRIFFMDLY